MKNVENNSVTNDTTVYQALVREIAERNPVGSGGRCHFCRAYIDPSDSPLSEPHTPDCLYVRACALFPQNYDAVLAAAERHWPNMAYCYYEVCFVAPGTIQQMGPECDEVSSGAMPAASEVARVGPWLMAYVDVLNILYVERTSRV